MGNKEQRSVEQVHQLLRALGFHSAQVLPKNPPHPDVFAEFDDRRIAIETTDFYGDRKSPGGSGIRRDERLDVRAGRVRTYAVPTDPLPGLVSCIQTKASKQYELSMTDEVWLAIFAAVPELGATAATFLVTAFLNLQLLTSRTVGMLERSPFRRSYIFCGLTVTGRPKLYSWVKGGVWTEVAVPGRVPPERMLTFWDIQKVFRHL
jgi:hypothetical protein